MKVDAWNIILNYHVSDFIRRQNKMLMQKIIYIYIYIVKNYCKEFLYYVLRYTLTHLFLLVLITNDYNIPFRKCQCHSNIGRLQSKATQNPIFIIIKVIIFCPNKMCFVAIHSFHAFRFYFSFFMQLKKCTVLL